MFRWISLVNTPPRVSIPSDKGVTSRSRISFTSPRNTPAWIAAPIATTSSGFTPVPTALQDKMIFSHEHTFRWCLFKKIFNGLDHFWHPAHSSNKNHLFDVGLGNLYVHKSGMKLRIVSTHACILHAFFARLDRSLH